MCFSVCSDVLNSNLHSNHKTYFLHQCSNVFVSFAKQATEIKIKSNKLSTNTSNKNKTWRSAEIAYQMNASLFNLIQRTRHTLDERGVDDVLTLYVQALYVATTHNDKSEWTFLGISMIHHLHSTRAWTSKIGVKYVLQRQTTKTQSSELSLYVQNDKMMLLKYIIIILTWKIYIFIWFNAPHILSRLSLWHFI